MIQETSYRIYFDEKLLLITDTLPDGIEGFKDLKDEKADLKIITKAIVKSKSERFLILASKPKAIFKKLLNSVKVIEAAGGLVRNERKDCLVIFRNGVWDLPKGKIEQGEKTKIAAIREVEEECGIIVKKAGRKICKTYHVYLQRNNEIAVKKTHWYRMRAEGQEKLKPQKEEGITKAAWFTKDKLSILEQNTYPSILDVLENMGLLTEKEAPLKG